MDKFVIPITRYLITVFFAISFATTGGRGFGFTIVFRQRLQLLLSFGNFELGILDFAFKGVPK